MSTPTVAEDAFDCPEPEWTTRTKRDRESPDYRT